MLEFLMAFTCALIASIIATVRNEKLKNKGSTLILLGGIYVFGIFAYFIFPKILHLMAH
jgi:hypothetical protein